MIVIDTSAIAAILFEEPEAASFRLGLSEIRNRRISAVTDYETRVVVFHRGGGRLLEQYELLISDTGASIVPFDHLQSALAFEAYRRYGKGNHPAGLNLADCAAYALARSLDAPLLFKGDDFARTDVCRAL